MFVRVKGSDLVKEFTPSEADVAKYYEEHREAFREPDRVAIDAVRYSATDFEKNTVAQTPLGRLGQPEDIATIAAFLASDDSKWLTGELVKAGGGLR